MTKDPIEIAWLAGLYEGEGCLSYTRSRPRGRWNVYLGMTDMDVVYRFRELVGWPGQIGIVRRGLLPGYPENYKTMYRITFGGVSRVTEFTDTLYAQLGQRRRMRIDEFRAWRTARPDARVFDHSQGEMISQGQRGRKILP